MQMDFSLFGHDRGEYSRLRSTCETSAYVFGMGRPCAIESKTFSVMGTGGQNGGPFIWAGFSRKKLVGKAFLGNI